MAKIMFKFGTQEQYNALLAKDENTLYWLYDVLELRKGEELYGTGREATDLLPGLMSAEDKANLDRLVAAGTHVMTTLDASINLDINEESGIWKIGVAVSEQPGNALELKEDGLFVAEDMGEDIKYEIVSMPEGTIVDYREKEIRVMCPDSVVFTKQNVGATGNANMYYMGFRAYAPEGAVNFKEGDQGVVEDKMFAFDDDFAGTDEFGRKYSIVWLALAIYDEASDTWSYYGDKSSTAKYIGWTYVVEWYDANGVMISADKIRINLTNADCHDRIEPYYMAQYATAEELETALAEVSESLTWGTM